MTSKTQTLWVNFYALGNGSIHFTRETADKMAEELPENPRIACRPVTAKIGDGLVRAPERPPE